MNSKIVLKCGKDLKLFHEHGNYETEVEKFVIRVTKYEKGLRR